MSIKKTRNCGFLLKLAKHWITLVAEVSKHWIILDAEVSNYLDSLGMVPFIDY